MGLITHRQVLINSSLLVFERFVNSERKTEYCHTHSLRLKSPERLLLFLSLAVTVEA